jgi:hypothetical protein
LNRFIGAPDSHVDALARFQFAAGQSGGAGPTLIDGAFYTPSYQCVGDVSALSVEACKQ